MDKNVIVTSIAAALAALAGLAYVLRHRFSQNSSKRRRSDKRLNNRERKSLMQARTLAGQGQFVQAAHLLEKIGLIREAVNLLQESGNIDEAANVLLRLRRPNRAGVIYTRHGMWEKAAECFKMAHMPLEVARCARECGDFSTAATHFLKADHFAEAAECYVELGDIKKAARYFAKSGNQAKGIDSYLKLIEDNPDPGDIAFEPDELDFLVEAVVRGNTAVAFARVLDANHRLLDAITNLVRFGNPQGAAKLYAFTRTNIDQTLIDSIGISENAGLSLAELFKTVDKPLQAALTYEKIEYYKEAAAAYEEAESYKEAAECYKALGNHDKQLEMRSRARTFGLSGNEPTAKLRPGDVAGLEATGKLEPKKALAEAGETFDDEELTGAASDPESEDTRSLADQTFQMAHSYQSYENSKITTQLASNEPVDESSFQPIPLSANPAEPPPMIERKPQVPNRAPSAPAAPPAVPTAESSQIKPTAEKSKQSLRPSAPMFHPRPPDDEDVLDNRGGNLPDEKYKVKAGLEDDGTYDNSDMNEVFARSKILYDLKKAEKRLLWKLGETRSYKEGEVLLEPNQTPRGIFFVLSGSLTVMVGPNSNNEGRREVYPGETFAAHWALLDELIEARFTAKEITEVRIISREDLQFLLDNNGTLARKLYKNMTRQIRFDFITHQNHKTLNQAS